MNWTTSDYCLICSRPAEVWHEGRMDLPCCGSGKCEAEIEDREAEVESRRVCQCGGPAETSILDPDAPKWSQYRPACRACLRKVELAQRWEGAE